MLVVPNGTLTLVDITTDPVTSTVVANNLGTGTIGPDGCLYASSNAAIYKVTNPAGGCGFTPTNPRPPAASRARTVARTTLPSGRTTPFVVVRNVACTVRLAPGASVPRFHVASSATAHPPGNVPASEIASQPLLPNIPAGTGMNTCTSLAAVARRLVTVSS